MSFKKFLKAKVAIALTAVAVVTALGVGVTVSAIPAGSIPYVGEETSGTNFPAFNIFNGVPSVGNEADFIRVKKDGEANATLRNTVDATCKTGDRFDVWFYVHNGAKPSQNNNGSGPGVAKDVVAKVNLPKDSATSFPISGGVTASNAQAINDGATINCGNKKFKMKYVSNSASAFLDLENKVVNLPQAIVEGGTPIGTKLLNGDVWGCWDQRVWMGLKVEVEEITEVEPSLGVCKTLDMTVVNRDEREVSARVNGEVTNAQIVGYKIDFGDGTVVNQQSANHKYAADGTYNIVGSVQIKFADGTTQWKTATTCAKEVKFEAVVVPSFSCDALAVQQLSRTSYKFTVAGSAQNASITGYQFSLNGTVVQDSASNTYTLNQTNPGNYTVSAIVKTDKGNTSPTAVCTKTVTIVEEEEEPIYACDLLTLTALGDRKVRLSVDASASNGATIKRYIYNFGDGSQPLVTDKNMVEYQYKKDGTFNSTVQVVVEVDGEEQIITSENCAASVTFKPGKPPVVVPPNAPEVPGSLPNTGAGDVILAFLAVTVGSTVAYYAVVRRFAGL